MSVVTPGPGISVPNRRQAALAKAQEWWKEQGSGREHVTCLTCNQPIEWNAPGTALVDFASHPDEAKLGVVKSYEKAGVALVLCETCTDREYPGFGYCPDCDANMLLLPDGSCSQCHASESIIAVKEWEPGMCWFCKTQPEDLKLSVGLKVGNTPVRIPRCAECSQITDKDGAPRRKSSLTLVRGVPAVTKTGGMKRRAPDPYARGGRRAYDRYEYWPALMELRARSEQDMDLALDWPRLTIGPPAGEEVARPGLGSKEAKVKSTTRLSMMLSEGTTFRPGERVPVALRVEPWPDKKATGLTVRLTCSSTHLIEHSEYEGGSFFEIPNVRLLAETSQHEVNAEDLELGDGRVEMADPGREDGRLEPGLVLETEVVVPDHAPCSIEGVISWTVDVQLHRKLGVGPKAAHEVTILPPSDEDLWVRQGEGERKQVRYLFGSGPTEKYSPEELGEDEADQVGHRSDWVDQCVPPPQWEKLLPVKHPPGEYPLCPPRRRQGQQQVRVEIHTSAVAPLDVVSGAVVVECDPRAYYLEHAAASTERGRRKLHDEEVRLSELKEVDLKSVHVALECWRLGWGRKGTRNAYWRVLEVEQRIAGPLALRPGEPAQFPFEVAIPDRAMIWLSQEPAETFLAVPPTFHAATVDLEGKGGSHREGRFKGQAYLDDFRWRLVGWVLPGSLGAPLPQLHTNRFSPAQDDFQNRESPLWGATEVLVGPPQA